jgi:hypothetical protein
MYSYQPVDLPLFPGIWIQLLDDCLALNIQLVHGFDRRPVDAIVTAVDREEK